MCIRDRLSSHLLKGLLCLVLPHGIEMRAANLVLKKPLFCKGAVLDIGQNLLHGLLCLVGYNLWSGDIIAVLSCIGNGITHACKTALVNQIHNQLHLMPVSYTHLDVYKRQLVWYACIR